MNQQNRQSPTGRGTGLNQVGRFESTEIELDWSQLECDDELHHRSQCPKTRYFEDVSCTVISENDSPDIPFRYSLNPYRGCLHDCPYCPKHLDQQGASVIDSHQKGFKWMTCYWTGFGSSIRSTNQRKFNVQPVPMTT